MEGRSIKRFAASSAALWLLTSCYFKRKDEVADDEAFAEIVFNTFLYAWFADIFIVSLVMIVRSAYDGCIAFVVADLRLQSQSSSDEPYNPGDQSV